jgi:hypothetical protein
MQQRIQNKVDFGLFKFFRSSIAQLSESDIILKTKEFELEIKQLKDNLYRIGWYMRGSFTYENLMYHTTVEDREILNKIIKDNIETTEKTKMPLL